MSRWKSLSSSCLSMVLMASLAQADAAATRSGSSARDGGATKITAKTMTVRNQESKAIFQGSVVLNRGGLTVHSDEMVVFFKSVPPGGPPEGGGDRTEGKAPERMSAEKPKRGGEAPTMQNRSISMIEATGSVVIEKDEGRATCRKAIYYEAEEKIVLLGDPVAWQKGTRVSGERMTMYLADDRSVVEGGTQVVIEEAEQRDR
jgi:lipopolysaccharide export system protein LptA